MTKNHFETFLEIQTECKQRRIHVTVRMKVLRVTQMVNATNHPMVTSRVREEARGIVRSLLGEAKKKTVSRFPVAKHVQTQRKMRRTKSKMENLPKTHGSVLSQMGLKKGSRTRSVNSLVTAKKLQRNS